MPVSETERIERTISDFAEAALGLTAHYGLSVLGGIVLLVAGWWLASRLARLLDRVLSLGGRVDPTLRGFLVSVLRWLLRIVVLIAVLDNFGVETTSLIAVLGTAGLAIGLALQGTLSNVAAGIMLLAFRPFKVGDFIEAAGLAGTVRALNLFTTELVAPDNIQILAPNSQIWGSAIRNYSTHDTRRQDVSIGIGYGDSIDRAMAVARGVMEADSRVLADPPPQVMVTELGESSVTLTGRFWSRSADAWALRCDLVKAFKERFDAEGITIPFPQRVIHRMPTETT